MQCLLTIVTLWAIWTIGSPPGTRADVVSELTLTATVLGFIGTVTALLWAVQSARDAVAPPRLELRAQHDDAEITYILPPVGSGGSLQNYGMALPIQLVNHAPARCDVHRIAASAVIVSIRRRGWGTQPDPPGFKVEPSRFPRLLFGHLDLAWNDAGDDEWVIDTPFTLQSRQVITLPDFMVQPDDLTAALDLLWFSQIAFRLTLAIHTHRGSVPLTVDIPIRGIRPPRSPSTNITP